MTPELQESGLDVVGELPWGSHFCFFYETPADLMETIGAFFSAGLRNNDVCLWVVLLSEVGKVEEAQRRLRDVLPDLDAHLANERIFIARYEDWMTESGQVDLNRAVADVRQRLESSMAKGRHGMRVVGGPAWLHGSERAFEDYESQLDKLILKDRMIVLCDFPLETAGAAEILAAARTHQFTVVRRHGEWEVFEAPELAHIKAEIKRLNEELQQRVHARTQDLAASNHALRTEIAERQPVEDALRKTTAQLRGLAARLQLLIEEERIRISREIHDELGQKLTGLKMDLVWVKRKLSEITPRAPPVSQILKRVSGLPDTIDDLIAAVQEIAAQLRPGVLDQLGLGAALQFEGRRFQEKSGVHCEVSVPDPEPAVSAAAATALFRIFQECLTNVARHAGATEVEVHLTSNDEWIELSVADNGRGIPPESDGGPASLGLLGMKERAALLGGSIRLEPRDPHGTVVTARVPGGRKEMNHHAIAG